MHESTLLHTGDINPLEPLYALHGRIVAIEQVGVCGSRAVATEDSLFHLDKYYE